MHGFNLFPFFLFLKLRGFVSIAECKNCVQFFVLSDLTRNFAVIRIKVINVFFFLFFFNLRYCWLLHLLAGIDLPWFLMYSTFFDVRLDIGTVINLILIKIESSRDFV